MTPEQEIAIRVSHLSKMYRVYSHPADMFWETALGKQRFKPFWALQDITFEVPRGTVVGIMGRNGAGKSTLLKIISGTLDKTGGEVTVNGRISSILELGTGFNLEYTGRQNIYLGGLMVGLTREEILQKTDWIIEFSELESVIDQAFKTYSTGMQARLTFSTAVCIDPDILIIDEALSVGDAKFARKSYGKIEEFRNAGRTILLVSHDINTISNFCDHAILLENGKIYEQGKPYNISQVYYQLLFATPEEKKDAIEGDREAQTPQIATSTAETPPPISGNAGQIAETSPVRDQGKEPHLVTDSTPALSLPNNQEIGSLDRETIRKIGLQILNLEQAYDQGNIHQKRIGNKKAEILDYGILDEDGNNTQLLLTGYKYRLFFHTIFYEDVRGATSGFVIRNAKGVDMFGTSSLVQKLPTLVAKRGTLVESVCELTMWLTNGIYFMSVAMADPYADHDVQYDLVYDAYQFEIRMKEGIFTTSVVNLDPQPITRNVLMGEANLKPLENYILANIH